MKIALPLALALFVAAPSFAIETEELLDQIDELLEEVDEASPELHDGGYLSFWPTDYNYTSEFSQMSVYGDHLTLSISCGVDDVLIGFSLEATDDLLRKADDDNLKVSILSDNREIAIASQNVSRRDSGKLSLWAAVAPQLLREYWAGSAVTIGAYDPSGATVAATGLPDWNNTAFRNDIMDLARTCERG